MRVAIGAGEIHLWLAFYNEIGEPLLDSYRAILSGPERLQERRFHFAVDRRRYIVTRALVRTVLSACLPGVAPQDWIFTTNEYGRPDIAREHDATDAGLSFNISHTADLIVLGVARERALGVDVENVRSRDVSIGIAEYFFAPDEVHALARLPASQQQRRFFEYWTFKESYIKARGMGLSLPLDKFAFHFPRDDAVAIEIELELHDRPERWDFWQLRPTPDHLLAVCAERTGEAVAKIFVKKSVPMVAEEEVFPAVLRRSARTPATV